MNHKNNIDEYMINKKKIQLNTEINNLKIKKKDLENEIKSFEK
jgi:hypothetical protein